jgi:hypothetical protein
VSHSYAAELAAFALERWHEIEVDPDPGPCRPTRGALPDPSSLEHLLSVAYQASLLREEDRPVRFRLFVGRMTQLAPGLGPPDGLHGLAFTAPRNFDEHEIRRLSLAAKYHRALIGVQPSAAGGFEIWGMVQSGPRWMQSARGGRGLPSPIPADAVVVRANAPGHLAVAVGDVTLAELRGGKLSFGRTNLFESRWLSARFAPARTELLALHEEALRGSETIPLDPDLTRAISQQMVKRLISTIQEARHGGTVVFVPHDRFGALSQEQVSIRLKYAFAEGEPRRRYRTLMLSIMRELVTVGLSLTPRPQRVGFRLYQGSQRTAIVRLDEAILEMSQLIAGLADVDGAVLLNERFELLGFGGEITGALPEVETIRRAHDLEANNYVEVPIDGVGTRHRAAYRLCAKEHGALANVVSQDGSVQFVAWHNDGLTYWEHRND